MILSVTLSKPAKNIADVLGENYVRAKVKLAASSRAGKGEPTYFCELFTETQVFHKKMSGRELDDFLSAHEGTTFRSCVERTEREEIHVLSSKKGKITRLSRPLPRAQESPASLVLRAPAPGQNREKRRIIAEGTQVPFLVRLGVMTAEGKVVASKHEKFRQINRFLEFADDIIPGIVAQKKADSDSTPLSVVDFGSGKSYLTFALHYYLSEIKGIGAEIFGLDLKADVIGYCSSLAQSLGLSGISFAVGDISSFRAEKRPDLIVTLHACDTATDYALDYAIKKGARAILSVPCCQHELNSQLKANLIEENALGGLSALLRHGLIKERFAALLTDAVRAELLEREGYKVSVLEFIDESATPKNLLIRAVKKRGTKQSAEENRVQILDSLGVRQTLAELLGAGKDAESCSKTEN